MLKYTVLYFLPVLHVTARPLLLLVSCFPHWGLQKQLFGLRLPLRALSWQAAASTPSAPSPTLPPPLAPVTGWTTGLGPCCSCSFQARVSVLGVGVGAMGQAGCEQGRGGRVVLVATHQHAGPPHSHPPALALCPVALQGGDLDNVAGYGRNVPVGAWAGRGRPALALGS